MGAWLNRKEVNLSKKRDEALALLQEAGEVGRDEGFIRAQWAAQVKEQTKPAPRKSPGDLVYQFQLIAN